MTEKYLAGQTALVTGSSRGIGRAIALELAKCGANLVINSRSNQQALDEVANEITNLGQEARLVLGDIGRKDDVIRLVNETVNAFGRIDILVNNAGVTHPVISMLDLELEHLDAVINTNFRGVYLCSRQVGRLMRDQGCGVIINISSLAGQTPLPLAVYGPMKSAINMLTRIMARDMAEFGIRVNAVAPGYVLTPLVKNMIERGLRNSALLMKRVPMHSWIEPEDVAEAVVFLTSERARFITGEILTIDAGWAADGGWSAYDLNAKSKNLD